MSFLSGLFGGGNRADATISVNAKTDGAEKNLNKLQGTIKTLISAYVVQAITRYTIQLGELGGQAKLVEKNFESFAQKAGKSTGDMMAAMRKATKGMVSDMELQQKAMKSMISGVNFDDMIVAMEYVTKYAIATGEDVNVKMQSVMTGFARKSAMFLDDVGINVMGASDVVGAAVEQMKEKMNTFADSTGAAAEKTAQMKANIENLKLEIGENLIPVQQTWLKLVNSTLTGYMYALGVINAKGEKEKVLIEQQLKRQREMMNTVKAINEQLAEGKETIYYEEAGELIVTSAAAAREELKMLNADIQKAAIDIGVLAGTGGGGGKGGKTTPPGDTGDKGKAEKYELESYASAEDARRQSLAAMREYEAAASGISQDEYDRRLEIQKQFHDSQKTNEEIWRDEQYALLEEKFDGITDMEEEKLAMREQIRQEYERRMTDNAIREFEREQRERERISNDITRMLAVNSDILYNVQVRQLKKSAKSQEEYDKKMAEIQKQAANRQYVIALFRKGVALGEALASAVKGTVVAGAESAYAGGPVGAALGIALAAAEFGAVIAEMSAVNIPEPKFRMGRMGRRNRGGFGDIEPAMIDPAETIVPAAQSAIYRDELQAIVNNTAGLRSMGRGGGNTYIYQGVSTEQLLQATVATDRRNATGRRL